MQYRKLSIVLVVLALVFSVVQPALAASSSARLAPMLAVPGAIQGRYIVVFHDFAAPKQVDTALSRISGSPGVAVHYRYSAALKGFAATLPDKVVNILRANPDIAYIEADQIMTIDTSQTNATWGLDRTDQRSLPLNGTFTYSATGTGVTAYIIDTGIRTSHTQFGTRASVGTDKINDGRNGIDCNGHGTHVAGTVGGSTYGIAKSVRLVAVRVLNCSGSGTTSGVIAGVDWVTADHDPGEAAVANMSLGGGASTSLDNAVKRSISDGVTYALAAGNNGINACNRSPARVPEGITVGATDRTDTRPNWSNFGSCLDLFAPGVSITSAWHTSTSATNTISGTSMATPHVAGVAALYLQTHTSASPTQVRNALVNNTTSGVVKSPGGQSPNRLLFSNY